MATKKKITVGDSGYKLGSDTDYKIFLSMFGVRSLRDSDRDEIVGFDALDDDGTYLNVQAGSTRSAAATAGTLTVARPLQQRIFLVYFADSTTKETCYCLIYFDLTHRAPLQQQQQVRRSPSAAKEIR